MVEKILMADDEADVVEIIKKRLGNSGYQVLGANDGKRALDLTNQYIPDLIVTDVMMPVMNGFEFCKAVKNNSQTKDIPIIVVSGNVRTEDAFLYLGIKDFLHKPFKLEQLEHKIIDKISLAKEMRTQKTKMIFHSERAKVASTVESMMSSVPQWAASFTNSGRELLTMAKRCVPDLVVMDLLMSDYSIQDLVTEMKTNQDMATTMLLLYYSPLSENEDAFTHQARMIEIQYLKNAALLAGAQDYLGPFNPHKIMDLLNAYRKDVCV